jgi:hypothetical protein
MYFKKSLLLITVFDIIVLSVFFSLKYITAIMLDTLSGCIFLKYGFICPSCGGTRAVHNFVTGNFIASFNYNPYIFGIIIYLIAAVIILNLEFLLKLSFAKKIRKLILNYKVIIGLAVGYAVFGILRNFL